LKTTEEVGELAKDVLLFENAASTLHRFTNKNKILENVVDIYLSAISIAYSMGFSDDDIEDMISRKLRKWSMLQSNEKYVKFPLPYEIHITIERPHDIELFKEVCEKIKVKPIIIDLEKDDIIVMSDVMTSSVHYGDNQSALTESDRIATELHEKKYNVLRTKIETVPWHPEAPSIKNNLQMKEGNYFESHLRIVTTLDQRPLLDIIAFDNKAHLSRNFFKKINNAEYIIMMTLRNYNVSSEVFSLRVNSLKEILVINGFEVDMVEIEFAIYDSNDSYDSAWIK